MNGKERKAREEEREGSCEERRYSVSPFVVLFDRWWQLSLPGLK